MMAVIESAISLPDRYILSLSKNENKFNEKNKTKQSWKIHSRKASMVLTVKAVLWLISSLLKNIWPTSVSQNRREVSKNSCSLRFSAFMREKNTYDSAAVNISVFIEQRNISFQNDISLKTMRLGVLSGEKLKNRETHGRNVSLDQLGNWRAIADLFVMFIPWQVKKLQKFINVCLKVGYSANLKHSKSTRRQLIAPWKCTKS